MADTAYNYTKTPVAVDRLEQEIRASAIITALRHATTLGSALTITMADALSNGDETILNGIVTAHTGDPMAIAPTTVTIANQLTDADGAALTRPKQTAQGWTFQGHLFEFTPGKLGVFNKNYDNTDLNFVTLKFYELIDGVETLITGANATDQTYLDANCIKTYADFEPTHDFDVIAGEMRFYTQIEADIRMWTVIAPDIPANMGGSKVLVVGRNLRHMQARVPHVVDGRVSKHLTYNAVYHTNKFRFIIRHGANAGVPIEMCVQFYKA